jgi:P27 family predicted phage terminase small subunit
MGKRGPTPSGKLSVIQTPKTPPKPPKWLGKWGSKAWKDLCAAREFGPADMLHLEAYCHAYQEFHESREKWEEGGKLYEVPAGNGGMRENPLIGIMNGHKKQLKDLGSKLGLFGKQVKDETPKTTISKRKMFGA